MRRIYNRFICLINEIICFICTYLTYIKFRLLDIRTGKKCKFYGSPYVYFSKKSIIEIGDNCVFRSQTTSNPMGLNHQCMITTGNEVSGKSSILKIGNNCGFSGVTIRCFDKIIIGNNVRIGANSLIIDGDAHFNDPRSSKPKPIIIEDNVFIGANCIVKKGVRIGRNSVVGMNSVVTKDIPEDSIAVGIPAKIIKSIK